MRRCCVAGEVWIGGRGTWLPVLLLLWAVAASGCGGGEDYEVAPVSGQVLLDGGPVPEVRIKLQPKAMDSKNVAPGPGSYAIADEYGRFELKLVKPQRMGAVVGTHVVRITHSDKVKYPFPVLSGNGTLEFEVPPEGTNSAEFRFDSPKRRQRR